MTKQVIKPRVKEKVINIIGMGWSGQQAPFDCGERWGINCSYAYGALDKVFWMHQPALIPQSLRLGEHTKSISHIIKQFPDMEIITLCKMSIELNPNPGPEIIFNFDVNKQIGERLKVTTEYPVLDYDGKITQCAYATSTLMYIIGLAILQNADRIRLYGVELFSRLNVNEYEFERQGVEHLLFMAMGKGIKVEIPFQCMITASNNTNNRYGYQS